MAWHVNCIRCGSNHEDIVGDSICCHCRKPEEYPEEYNYLIEEEYLDSWIEMMESRAQFNNDDISSFKCTIPREDMERKFKNYYGGMDFSPPFIAWTEKFVYFSTFYDGLADVESQPRNPQNETHTINRR